VPRDPPLPDRGNVPAPILRQIFVMSSEVVFSTARLSNSCLSSPLLPGSASIRAKLCSSRAFARFVVPALVAGRFGPRVTDRLGVVRLLDGGSLSTRIALRFVRCSHGLMSDLRVDAQLRQHTQ
jgi:hypothetical protein